jgi:hypothetical protein
MEPNRYFVDKNNPVLKALRDDEHTEFGNGVLARMRLTPDEWMIDPRIEAVAHNDVGTLSIDFDTGRVFHSPLGLDTFSSGMIVADRQRMLTMKDSVEIIAEIAVMATRGLNPKPQGGVLGQNNQTVTGAAIQAQQQMNVSRAKAQQAALAGPPTLFLGRDLYATARDIGCDPGVLQAFHSLPEHQQAKIVESVARFDSEQGKKAQSPGVLERLSKAF